jgi:4-amino-4-deoxy-L-arabinose transferase-like glycosyltransferase
MSTDARGRSPSRDLRKRIRVRVARSARAAAGAPRPLVLLLVVAAILSLAWSLSVPGFQAPDEEPHFAYAQYLAETGSPPHLNVGTGSLSTEAKTAVQTAQLHSLVGIPGARPAWTSADLRLWKDQEARIGSGQRSDGSGPNRAGANPPLYYVYEAIPYRASLWGDLYTRLLAMRLWTGVLMVLTVAMVWAIAGEVFGPDRWRQTVAAGVTALQPMLGYIGSTVSPDGFLTFIWTAFVLVALRILRRGPSLRRFLALGVLAAASMLTHGRGLAIVPPLIVVLLVAAWRYRAAGQPDWRRHLGWATAAIALAAGPVLAWRLLHHIEPGGGGLYGSQASFAGTHFSVKQLVGVTWQFYFHKLPFMQARIGPDYGYRQVFIETFFGTFGSLEVRYPAWVYDRLQLGAAVGLVALVATTAWHAPAFRRNIDVVVVLSTVGLSMLALLHIASYLNLLQAPGDPVFTGRYLLPLISLFALAIAWVVGALPRRASLVTGAAVLGVGVLMSLAALGLSAARFYA